MQKQIEFLEAHPECSGAFHETQQLQIDGMPGRIFGQTAPDLMTAADTFTMWSPFHTSSLVFRNALGELPPWLGEVVSGDMALFSIVSRMGPLKKIPGVMSVYRKHSGGITSLPEVNHRLHEQRIELMHRLNEFHGFAFDAQAQKVIRSHEREIAKAQSS